MMLEIVNLCSVETNLTLTEVLTECQNVIIAVDQLAT